MQATAPSFIASEELLWIKADGSEIKLIARVGVPYEAESGQFRCPVELAGLDGRYPDIAGESSMQAMCLATSLLATRLKHLLQEGERLVYIEDRDRDDSSWDISSLNAVFGR